MKTAANNGASARLQQASAEASKRWRARGFTLAGVVTAFGLLGGFSVWAATTKLAGAVIAPAEVKVEGQRKVVQHPEGGVIEEILVRDGDLVSAGDVMIRLDPTQLASQLEIVESQLDELLARQARLGAEMIDAADIEIEAGLAERVATRPQAKRMLDGQQTLFNARKETMARRFEQLDGRIAQTGDEIGGIDAQIAALDRQIALIQDELTAQRSLLRRGLTEKSRVIALEREDARLGGERGRLISNIARLKGRISEVEINKLELASSRREEAITTLRDLGARVAELVERRTALAESLSRIEIRAPSDGAVLDLSVNTIGGVVRPADPLLFIVPEQRDLVIEAKIPPISRDRLFETQSARVLFPSFNQRSTPELNGVVAQIGADSLVDERTNQPYYLVKITLSEGEFQRLYDSGVDEIGPGLPAEVHIQTSERTAANYLLKPLIDNFNRAFRER